MSVTTELDRLDLGAGAFAVAEGPPDGRTLRVVSAGRRLVFEIDARREKVRVLVGEGDLEFATGRGDIAFTSAKGIRLEGESVEVTGRSRVRVGVRDAVGRLLTALRFGPRRATWSGPDLQVEAGRAEARVGEMRCSAERVRLVAGRVETIARSVVERVKNAYRTVEGLALLRAGRARTLVDDTYQLKSRRAYLKGEKDVKINGDKIHLG